MNQPTKQPRKHQNIRPTPDPEDELAPREKIILVGGGDEDEGGGGDRGGGEEASDAEALGGGEKSNEGVAEEEARELGEVASLRVLGDGGLSAPKAELLALARADRYEGHEARAVVPGGMATSYAQRVYRSPVFRERVKVLEAERDRFEAMGLEGEALWAVKQNWRLARAGGVVTEIHRATNLLVETTRALLEREGGVPAPPVDGEVPRGPGRPPNQPKALKIDIERMKAGLLTRGTAPRADA